MSLPGARHVRLGKGISMKKRLVTLLLVSLTLFTTLLSLGARGCGTSPEEEDTAATKIATVEDMRASRDFGLHVYLQPTSAAQANREYKVDLYDKGTFRETTSVSWAQPQINVHKVKTVYFSLSREEHDAYDFLHPDISFELLGEIFSVKVHE